jgi:YidC/Oxa1 family membrane protein insertase
MEEGRMNMEARLVLAIVLMVLVLVGTNLLFPPGPPPSEPDGDVPAEVAEEVPVEPAPTPRDTVEPTPEDPADPRLPALDPVEDVPDVRVAEDDLPETEPSVAERRVTVEGPLYRFLFSDRGARVVSLELPEFPSFARPGPVELVADPEVGMLGSRILVGADTVDLRRVAFTVEPEDGLRLDEGSGEQSLTFTYEHPTEPFSFQVRYHFVPDEYTVRVSGRVRGLERGLLLTDLGRGLAFNEADLGSELREMAYAGNHLQEGIRTRNLGDVERAEMDDGPFRWAAVKSRYFVVGMLPSLEPGGAEYFGGIMSRGVEFEERRTADVAVTQSLGSGGLFDYRLFAGPQDYALLSALGYDFQEVNPIGWRFIRPILRPFVGIIMWVLVFLHETLTVGYGWVLIIFGVAMRILLFPLNHKAMRAQLRNLAVQPLLKDIQTRYKDEPEKMQKELMRLYKEHGFNPLAGCWPMLLPWPVLIALFFVFQNTIELRGVPFAWLPDLSAKDPFFILPVLLGISMFLMQWISFRTMEEVNPQMKMMMWLLPIFMVVIFANLPSGLNLYYLTANLATLPQSWWIANERKKVQAKGPPTSPKAQAKTKAKAKAEA